jgi:hypothetical protein
MLLSFFLSLLPFLLRYILVRMGVVGISPNALTYGQFALAVTQGAARRRKEEEEQAEDHVEDGYVH